MAASGPASVRTSRRGVAGRVCRGALVALVAVGSVACTDEGGVEVTNFTLAGVHAFSSRQILSVLATRTSGWLPWSAKAYFDRGDFDADLQRIPAFYADHGYPHAKVTAVHVELNPAQTAVKL